MAVDKTATVFFEIGILLSSQYYMIFQTFWLLSVEFGDKKRGLAIFLATKFTSHA